ncbi:UMP kinase [Candidatus Woesearchaeota archaeon CG10_big_fil_rev_8_21_14_0_10_30_7]|nr:MAG: UMP kinase [Candidatus Woesearchaeota archaeon CG10_big_fil_rev_8_21_14_0_10_30_7]
MKEKLVIVSVGGSLIVPDELNISWLKKFKKLIENYVKKGYKFVLISGGGKIARKYQTTARSIVKLEKEDIDWIGIHCTRLNAHLLRTIFRTKAKYRVIKNPNQKIKFTEKVLIAAGWKPGCSTDYDAVLLAKNFKANKLINLTNTDYVYDKDPKKFKNAKPVEKISWADYRKISGNKWDPGLNLPFDPVASKEAQKLKLKVAIVNGNNLKEFEKYLNNKKFKGTLIV